jgi:hypothetical protein
MIKKELTVTESLTSTLKSNDKDLMAWYDAVVENWICEKYTFKSEKQRKLAHYLALGLKPYKAALRAGYSKGYAKGGVYELLRINKKFKGKVEGIISNFRDTYPEFCKNMLPEISYVERRIVEQLVDKPETMDAVKAKVIRDMKRSAGVLGDDHVKPVQVQINLAVLQGSQERFLESEFPDVVDAEAESE